MQASFLATDDCHGHSLFPEQLTAAARQYGTPLWCYDARTIKVRIQQLKAFDVVRYAQKACSNLQVLRLIREAGVRVDAVSLGKSSGRCWPGSARKATRPASSSPATCSTPPPCNGWWN